jgi:hypothetical protein
MVGSVTGDKAPVSGAFFVGAFGDSGNAFLGPETARFFRGATVVPQQAAAFLLRMLGVMMRVRISVPVATAAR